MQVNKIPTLKMKPHKKYTCKSRKGSWNAWIDESAKNTQLFPIPIHATMFTVFFYSFFFRRK